ncbi:hypothetical protein FEM08_03460 [Flavobacterium gilvum]|nr:hypothetical protein FEM08_03460 [Flavobacterium gilvum]
MVFQKTTTHNQPKHKASNKQVCSYQGFEKKFMETKKRKTKTKKNTNEY